MLIVIYLLLLMGGVQLRKTRNKRVFIKNGFISHTFDSSLSHGQHPYLPTVSDAADSAQSVRASDSEQVRRHDVKCDDMRIRKETGR